MAVFGFVPEAEVLPLLPSVSTEQEQKQVINDIIQRLNNVTLELRALNKTQILTDQSGVKRMLFGFQQDGWGAGKSFGIKISRESIDVTTASSTQLLFQMDLETWLWYDNAGVPHTLIGRDDGGF